MVLYEPSKPKRNTYITEKDCKFIVRTLKKYGYKFEDNLGLVNPDTIFLSVGFNESTRE